MAVLPLTNIIVVIGGVYSATGTSTGTATNDVWMSSDGRGASWTQVTSAGPFPPFQDAAFTALYDSSTISSSNTQQYSTLILYTGGYESIFVSTDLAQTWSTRAAPWSIRTRGIFLADADNYCYFTGGAEDGAIWFSWNKAVSWTNLNTANYGYFNGPNNSQHSNRCASLPDCLPTHCAGAYPVLTCRACGVWLCQTTSVRRSTIRILSSTWE